MKVVKGKNDCQYRVFIPIIQPRNSTNSQKEEKRKFEKEHKRGEFFKNFSLPRKEYTIFIPIISILVQLFRRYFVFLSVIYEEISHSAKEK